MSKIIRNGGDLAQHCEDVADNRLAPTRFSFGLHAGKMFHLLAKLRHTMFDAVGPVPEDGIDPYKDREGKYFEIVRTVERELLRAVNEVEDGNPFENAFDEVADAVDAILSEQETLRNIIRDNPKYQTDNSSDPRVRAAVKDLTAGQCAYCDSELGDDWHVEHVVPKSAGGPDSLANYVPSCKACNSTKHARHVVEFIRNGKRYWRKPWETEEPVAINDVQPTLDAAE